MVTLPPSVLRVIQSTFALAFSSALVTGWKGLPQEAVNVPAGKFEGCFRRRAVTDWGGVHGVSDTWSQPAVPILGIVSSRAINKAYDMELVAFGLDGRPSPLYLGNDTRLWFPG